MAAPATETRTQCYELGLRYSEWASMSEALGAACAGSLPQLPQTSTVGRSKEKVATERAKAVTEFVSAVCALPEARKQHAFRSHLGAGLAEAASRQELLGRVEMLELELGERTMAMSALAARNAELEAQLAEAQQRLAGADEQQEQLVAALREEHEAELARMLEAAAQQAAEGAAVEQPAQATPTPAPAAGGPFNYTPDDRAGME